MSSALVFDGLAELRDALRKMPDDLARQAGPIVSDVANSAKGQIRTEYPEHAGVLRNRLIVTVGAGGRFGAAASVKSTAPHAYIFEKGTKRRATRTGADRGVMPKGDVFIPAVVRWRKVMYERLRDLLVSNGFEVGG